MLWRHKLKSWMLSSMFEGGKVECKYKLDKTKLDVTERAQP
jgi:hypothetical protein